MTPARNAIAFLVLLALIVLGQWMGGAYRAEFMEDSDESAHYVTGLMVHDYVASGFPWPPMKFAERFHQSYPRVALGHWPPGFYILESSWMFLFTESRCSILLFIASIVALWALLCLRIAGNFLGRWESWLLVLFLIATPNVIRASRMVMSEILMALLTLAALWTLHKLIERPCALWSIAFGLLASAAILTKATGVLLAPLPILAILSLRRFDLLKSPWFWLPAVMVVVSCGPWYQFAPYALHEKMERFGGPKVRVWRVAGFFTYLAGQFSWPVLAVSLAGWGRVAVRVLRGEEKSPFWVAAMWTIPAAWAFSTVIGAWETKHLVTLYPLLLLFAAVGLGGMITVLPGKARTIFRGLASASLLVLMGWHIVHAGKKPGRRLDEAASVILARPEFAGKPLLIVSDAAGEGAFVSEIAMREKRPGHVVLRGYKELTSYTRMGQTVTSRFGSPGELMRHFQEVPDQVIIYDPASLRDVHGEFIREMLKAHPGQWREVPVNSPSEPAGPHQKVPIRIFTQMGVLVQ